MKFPRGLFAILPALLCASSLPAWSDPGYRLLPIIAGPNTSVAVYDLNRRGEVVGQSFAGGQSRAFRWRAGQLTDLHDTIDPSSSYTQAVGINDRSVIVGDNFTNEQFTGFLVRGTQVSPLTVQGGGSQEFPLDINNREQIIMDSYGGPQSGSFFIDSTGAHFLEGMPGELDSLHAIAINERGAVLGNTRVDVATHAALWQDGAIMDLGVVDGASASFAYALNDLNHVVGIVTIGFGSQAMHWRNGTMSLLPQLVPNPAASSASGINNWGMIVGTTTLVEPAFRSTATFWLGNHVVELDSLVRADDPLKPFVHLESAEQINDRGDIVASGFDSRTPGTRTTFFMTLFNN